MSRISGDVWKRLTTGDSTPEGLIGRMALPDISERLIAAVDPTGTRHLLVLLSVDDSEFKDANSRGIRVETRSLVMAGSSLGRYIDFTCIDQAGHDMFDLIGGEIADRLGLKQEIPAEVASRVLARWRRVWGEPYKWKMGRDEQLGLFAELWFLRHWLIPSRGPRSALESWRGPLGGRHDFECQEYSVEVKCSASPNGHSHRINGLGQLSIPASGRLYLFSLAVLEERAGKLSLLDVVMQCNESLLEDAEATSLFERGLHETGYLGFQPDDPELLRVSLCNESLYEVRDDFPRITDSNLVAGVPPGVGSVEYFVDLEPFPHLRVAQKAEEGLGVLRRNG